MRGRTMWCGTALSKTAPALIAFLLAACADGSGSSDPGPLKVTWRVSGVVPVIIQFRPGETEAFGIIEKVAYRFEGSDVLVTYLDGVSKGTTLRYTMTGADTARTAFTTMWRIR